MSKRNSTIIKSCQQQLLRVDSRHRAHGSIAQFTYNPNAATKFRTMKLLSMEIPNSIYPISTARGTDLLIINQNGTIINVNLAEGSYSAADFATLLQNAANAAVGSNGAYTVTYNTETYKFTITNIVIINLLFSQSSEVSRVMGFSATDTGSLLSHTSTYIVDLSGVPYLTFDINPLPSGRRIISANGNTGIFTIPVRVPFNSVNYFEASGLGYDLISYSGTKHTLSNIRITVYDEFGRVPEMNVDWSMVLLLE